MTQALKRIMVVSPHDFAYVCTNASDPSHHFYQCIIADAANLRLELFEVSNHRVVSLFHSVFRILQMELIGGSLIIGSGNESLTKSPVDYESDDFNFTQPALDLLYRMLPSVFRT
jgi:hypothetical protein